MDRIIEFLQNNMGFSLKGLVIFLLPMLPNILFFILPKPNSSLAVANNHSLLDIIEHGSQAIFFVLLIFGVSKTESPVLCGYTILMVMLLLSYYGLWLAYYTVGTNFTMIMLMAIFPVSYFFLAEIWLQNLLAIVPLTIFGITHIIITYRNYSPH